ncbi:MAG: alpha/beta fold hydrolase, partial [Thermoleophilaceae bacterium]
AGGMSTPPVIFVPGFMQRGESWAPVAELVAERYPSACLDFRTHTFEERLGELRDAAPPGAAVVAYSMGGRLALQLAAREPERLAALVTVGAGPGIEDPAERRRRRAADEELAAWMEHASIAEVVARWERLPVFAGQSDELVERQRAGRLSHEPAQLARLLRSAGQGALAPVFGDPGRLATPLLALAGERDERYLQAGRRMAELTPSGETAAVAGAGHAAHLEQPARVARLVLDFLDEHLGERSVVD